MEQNAKAIQSTSQELTSDQIAEKRKVIDSIMESIGSLAGFKSEAFGTKILDQITGACYPKSLENDPIGTFKKVSNDLIGMKPQDSIEGMLATQMIATHHAAMKCFGQAAKATHIQHYQEYLNSANKLMRSFTAQMEALNRYRGKGQQKMTVEHVHVHAGAQAIVGNVTPIKHTS